MSYKTLELLEIKTASYVNVKWSSLFPLPRFTPIKALSIDFYRICSTSTSQPFRRIYKQRHRHNSIRSWMNILDLFMPPLAYLEPWEEADPSVLQAVLRTAEAECLKHYCKVYIIVPNSFLRRVNSVWLLKSAVLFFYLNFYENLSRVKVYWLYVFRSCEHLK